VLPLGVKKFDFSEEVELLGRPDSEHTLPGLARTNRARLPG
jgi:hypothetical protein